MAHTLDYLTPRFRPEFPLREHFLVADEDQRQNLIVGCPHTLFVYLEARGLPRIKPCRSTNSARDGIVRPVGVQHPKGKALGVKRIPRKPAFRDAGRSGKPISTGGGMTNDKSRRVVGFDESNCCGG